MKNKILVGIPVFDYTDKFVRQFVGFWSELITSKRQYDVGHVFIYRNQLDVAQNRIVKLALSSGYTHILFIEDDVSHFVKSHLDKLLDAHKDVVSGVYFASGYPYQLCVKGASEQRGLQKVESAHLGFTLIRTEIFKDLKEPWFQMDMNVASDERFYLTCAAEDIDVYADFNVVLEHRGITPANVGLYRQIGVIDGKDKIKVQ